MFNKLSKSQKIKYSLILNSGFALIELILGLFANSLTLISDAIHNWTDTLTLVIASIADRISRRGASSRNSYGLKRAGILASLINSFILVLIAFYIFYEAYLRLFEKSEISGGIITIVSLLGIGVNGFVAKLFSSEKKDLNIKSAYLNMLFDLLASVGAFVAGIAIYFTKMSWIDSAVGFVIGILLIYGAVEVVREALTILLEAVPVDIDLKGAKKTILNTPEVREVMDLHIWALTSEYRVLTAVVLVDENLLNHDEVINAIKQAVVDKHDIHHTTIELRTKSIEHID